MLQSLGSRWHQRLPVSRALTHVNTIMLIVLAVTASPQGLATQEETPASPTQAVTAPAPSPSPEPPVAKPTKPLPDLVISIRRHRNSGTETAVAEAKVRITGTDMEGEETDANGVVRLPMPSERQIGLQVMVAGEPTCVVDKVPVSASKPELKVKIEFKDNRCKASIQQH